MAELDAHDSKSCFARSESSIFLRPPNYGNKTINSLVELFSRSIKKKELANNISKMVKNKQQ